MVKKWSVSYPAVNGVEQRRVYVKETFGNVGFLIFYKFKHYRVIGCSRSTDGYNRY